MTDKPISGQLVQTHFFYLIRASNRVQNIFNILLKVGKLSNTTPVIHKNCRIHKVGDRLLLIRAFRRGGAVWRWSAINKRRRFAGPFEKREKKSNMTFHVSSLHLSIGIICESFFFYLCECFIIDLKSQTQFSQDWQLCMWKWKLCSDLKKLENSRTRWELKE